MQDFPVGAVCWLKSGSPAMTIRGVGAHVEGSGESIGLVQCIWVADGHIESGDFPSACLQLHNPGGAGFLSRDLSPHHVRG